MKIIKLGEIKTGIEIAERNIKTSNTSLMAKMKTS